MRPSGAFVLAATGVGLVIGGLIALRIRPERPLFVGVVAITLLLPAARAARDRGALARDRRVHAARRHRGRALLRLLGHLAAGARPERGALPRLGVGCDRVARADPRRLRDRRPARGRDRDRRDPLALRRHRPRRDHGAAALAAGARPAAAPAGAGRSAAVYASRRDGSRGPEFRWPPIAASTHERV